MAGEVQAGTTAVLKSGGVQVTVGQVFSANGKQIAECFWFLSSGELKVANIPVPALRVV
jgi:uncharacterized protein YodC (DUF2158 family)